MLSASIPADICLYLNLVPHFAVNLCGIQQPNDIVCLERCNRPEICRRRSRIQTGALCHGRAAVLLAQTRNIIRTQPIIEISSLCNLRPIIFLRICRENRSAGKRGDARIGRPRTGADVEPCGSRDNRHGIGRFRLLLRLFFGLYLLCLPAGLLFRFIYAAMDDGIRQHSQTNQTKKARSRQREQTA